MQTNRWQQRVPQTVGIFALGAAAALTMRGNTAGSQTTVPPVQPSQPALATQSAFEQVSDKLRSSVVFIKSRQTMPTPNFRQGAMQGDGSSPFEFPMPGQGQTPGGRQFRAMPSYPQRAEASGSGVIVRADGYILTNDHVVANADRVTVRLQDGREFVGKVSRDPNSDLAIVKIDAGNLPAAELADSDKVKTGQWAIAFGSPFGLSDTMTVGVVSSLKREEFIGGNQGRLYPSLIQTDASINPGNSGGPLVDLYGRVVGINVAIESPSGGNVGIGFAIPANTARYVMDQLIAHGSVTRGFLGITPASLDYDAQQRYSLKEGALVRSVVDGSPAAQGGLEVRDVITRFNDKPVTDEASLRDMIARTQPGQTVPVVVRRGSGERTLSVTIGSPNKQTASIAPDAAPSDVAPAAPHGKLGVQVGDANKADAWQSLGVENGKLQSGALVVGIEPGGPAQQAGIQPGDVITELNGRPVGSAEALSGAARDLKDSSTVDAVVRRNGPTGIQTILVPITLE